MIEVRFHGRGGQGAVLASTILASAAFREGKYVQAFPFFGVERRGAPVTAFTRMAQEKIRLRTEIYHPQYVVVLDPVLIEAVDVTNGLQEQGVILINTEQGRDQFHFRSDIKIITVPASVIALKHGLGDQAAPIVNTAILGALARVCSLVSLESITAAIREKISVKQEANIAAAAEAYERVESRE